MNKDQLMEYLSAAIDQGATIDVYFYNGGVKKEEAAALANQFAEITGGQEVKEKNGEQFTWLSVGESPSKLRGTFFYDDFMIDDIFGEDDESA